MDKKKIVIIGGGFGGVFCALGLRGAGAAVTLIDRSNHHLFQPLLYQAATGFLGMNDVAFPLRHLFRNRGEIDVIMDEVTGIDLAARTVLTMRGGRHDYDFLVLATGSRYSYFGHDEWRAHCLTLKSLEDAQALRHRLLTAFEQAEFETDPRVRRSLLNFVVIGGGPTGVELAGAIADFAAFVIPREYRRIKRSDLSLTLIEAGPRLLSAFHPSLSEYARAHLTTKGVRVLCDCPVEAIEADYLQAKGHKIETRLTIWAAGVEASPLAQWMQLEAGSQKRVQVQPDLSIPGYDNVFVIGDAALVMQDGYALPALASVAKQQGKYVAKRIRALIAGPAPQPSPFRYRDLGSMATIGRNAAVMQIGRMRLSGWLAWVIWGLVHIYFLTGLRNRLSVFVTWFWTYLTYGLGARILMKAEPPRADQSPGTG